MRTKAVTATLIAILATSALGTHLTPRDSAATSIKEIWDYQNDKIQGVSLGGWFVLEPYITPSLFTQFGTDESTIPVDEYTFTKKLGKTAALEQLEKHWSTYYVEQDFVDIKNFGLNLVRIPIGYWAFKLLKDDPYVQGQEKYLDMALQWARNQGLKVWIDLHGVPGSQNGFDNSGKRGRIGWQDTKTNMLVSDDTLNYIFGKYGGDNLTDTVIGIEVVNEPMLSSLNLNEALKFHYYMYYDYRVKHKSKNYFLIQEGFQPIGWWNDQFNDQFQNVSSQYMNVTENSAVIATGEKDKYFYGVVIDHHHYEVFTDAQLLKTSDERIKDIESYSRSIGDTQQFHKSLIGEWSGAITDCAKWLNGVGTGARYDGTYSVDQLNISKVLDWGELGRKTVKNKHTRPVVIEEHEDDEEDDEEDEQEYHFYDDWEDHDDKDYELEEEDDNDDEDYDYKRLRRRDTSTSLRTCSSVRKYDDFSDEHKEEIRRFIEAQLVYYSKYSAGWIFWNYKTEDAIEWDFKKLVEKDLFPMPFTNYKYFYTNGTEIPESKSNGILPASANGSSRLMMSLLLLFAVAVLV